MLTEEEAKTKMLRIFKNIVKEKPKDWASGHTAIRLAENIFTNVLRRDSHTAEVLPQDIEGKEIVEKTPEDILAELDNFVGIDSVKSEVEAMIKNIECTKLKKENRPLYLKLRPELRDAALSYPLGFSPQEINYIEEFFAL